MTKEPLRRGAVVAVMIGGSTEPLLSVVVQPAVLAPLETILVVPLGEDSMDAPLLRPDLDPRGNLGLGRAVYAMPELLTAVPRSGVLRVLAHIDTTEVRALDRALMLVTGLG